MKRLLSAVAAAAILSSHSPTLTMSTVLPSLTVPMTSMNVVSFNGAGENGVVLQQDRKLARRQQAYFWHWIQAALCINVKRADGFDFVVKQIQTFQTVISFQNLEHTVCIDLLDPNKSRVVVFDCSK